MMKIGSSPLIWVALSLLGFVYGCGESETLAFHEESLFNLQQVERNNSLSKRWFSIKAARPSLTSAGVWPNNILNLCYESDSTRTNLKPLVDQALRTWKLAGGLDHLSIAEFDSCRTLQNDPSRTIYILVTQNSNKASSCTVGYYPYGTPPAGMLLKFDPSVINPYATMVHEMGHCWGLYHEHQRPDLWPSNYHYGDGTSPTLNNLDCTIFPDWSQAVAKAQQLGFDPNLLCSDIDYARKLGYRTTNFLPLSPDGRERQTPGSPIDRDSVMIYNNIVGSKTLFRVVDGGPDLHTNEVPSPLDMLRMMQLYPAPNQTPINLNNLPFNPGNDQHNQFMGTVPGC